MSKVQIKSVFEQIASEVFVMRDVNKAKSHIIGFIENKGIKDTDKKGIINNVSKLNNINAVHRYICNSLLQYEGMSTNFNKDKNN